MAPYTKTDRKFLRGTAIQFRPLSVAAVHIYYNLKVRYLILLYPPASDRYNHHAALILLH